MKSLNNSLFNFDPWPALKFVLEFVGTILLTYFLIGMPWSALGQEPIGKAPAPLRSSAVEASPRPDERYRIGPGDVLEIRVHNRPSLSLDAVRVDSHGMIRMPLIEDDIRAACRTENELARELITHYLNYQRNPQVFVYVKEFNSQPVAIIGAVNKPGRFQLQRRVRLLELIAFSGGPTEKAGKRIQIAHTAEIPVCREDGVVSQTEEGAGEIDVYDFNDTLAGQVESNPYIQPGDVITVAEAEQAFVTGNVFKPSVILLKEPVSVSQAVAMAGGTLPDSNLNRVRIVRHAQGTVTKSEIFLNLTAVNQHRAEDVMLEPGDIVEVSTSGGKKFLRGLLGAVAPATANLPIYVLR